MSILIQGVLAFAKSHVVLLYCLGKRHYYDVGNREYVIYSVFSIYNLPSNDGRGSIGEILNKH